LKNTLLHFILVDAVRTQLSLFVCKTNFEYLCTQCYQTFFLGTSPLVHYASRLTNHCSSFTKKVLGKVF